jgi:hypothetical protein
MEHNPEVLKKVHVFFTIMLLGVFVFIGGCHGGGGDSKTSGPTITNFVETSGHVGDTVIITGTNFDATPANNTVKFNGTSATVASSTATQIVTSVPTGATTGPISVTVNSKTATSSSIFTVIETPSPMITNFVETSGHVGDTVIITGTNLDAVKANNIVKFNGTTAVVASSTSTQIVTYVPTGATTGPISVTVNSKTATSSSTFKVTDNTPVFAGYYYDSTNIIDIPCYWTGIGGTAIRNNLAGGGSSSAYAYSSTMSSDGTVYTAGYWNNDTIDIACYWKGTTRHDLHETSGDGTYALSITESNGTIYVSGYYHDSANNMDIPCYWAITNSGTGTGTVTRTDLDIGDTTKYSGYAFSIAIYNGMVYTAGYYYNSEDYIGIACYWTETARTDLGDGTIDSEAFSIAVSGGTVYTAGSYWDDANIMEIPCYWTDTVRTDLAGNGVDSAFASSIAIYNGTVYTSGIYNDGSKDISCYWTGTTRKNLAGDGTHYSEAFSIIVSDGTVYTGGSYNNGSNNLACYWSGTTSTPNKVEDQDSQIISSFIIWYGF